MSLAVVTFTKGDRPDLLERCTKSVARALPNGAQHIVIESSKIDPYERFDALQIAEYVAFVDDDDYVPLNSLIECYQSIRHFGLGMVFTNEVRVDIDGNIIDHPSFKNLTYDHICQYPTAAHHLVMVRSCCVTEKVIELHQRFGLGIEWFIALSAASSVEGVAHLPIDGYYWTQHEGQHSRKVATKFNSQLTEIRSAIKQTFKFDNPKLEIPEIS